MTPTITPTQAAALVTADRTTNPIYSIVDVRFSSTLVKRFMLIPESESVAEAEKISLNDRANNLNEVVLQQVS